jgi:DNA topoisomerase-1
VQSVALRLVVDREREIESFTPTEYWSIEALLAKQDVEGLEGAQFTARLHRMRGEELELPDRTIAQSVVQDLERAAYQVGEVKRGTRRRNPSPPFITSTLQQQAASSLGFTARRTMRVAQQLYEGVDLGDGPVGLITYMRTDSTNVAELAQSEARRLISEQFGEDYLPPEPPQYKTRAKRAQEAHEAIRPTSVFRTPASVRPHLDRNQARLYRLIWRRFVASQMAAAVYDTISISVLAGPGVEQAAGTAPTEAWPYLFRASGATLQFKGFLAVSSDENAKAKKAPDNRSEGTIPPLEAGEDLDLVQLLPEQHFTQPPPRYTEASLVRALEEHGIGRPSTYAPTLSTIRQRGYVERDGRQLVPSEVGKVVTDQLVEYFPDYIDVDFTAGMEEDLDRIAGGDAAWVPVLHSFYDPFATTLEYARASMPEIELGNNPTGDMCPECGHPLVYKYGRYGKFIGCSDFPNCRYRAPVVIKTGVPCPQCDGEIVEKRTRRGRRFFGCSNYKADDPSSCDFAVWQRPLPQACPACGGLLTESRGETAKCTTCGQVVETGELP